MKKVRQIIASSTTGTGTRIAAAKGSDIAKLLDDISTEFGYDKLNKEEKKARINFLRREFPDIAIENIISVISGVIAGRIPLAPGTDHKFTKKLSPEWFSAILVSFRLAWIGKKRNEKLIGDRKEEDSPGSTDEEFYIGLREIVQSEGAFPLGWNFAAVRRHLEKTGELNVSPEQLKEISDRAAQSVVDSAVTIREKRAARIRISDKNFKNKSASDRMIVELHFKQNPLLFKPNKSSK
jgi:hypothetical protein